MATEIDKDTGIITTDGDFFWVVNRKLPHKVKIWFTTPGTAGEVALKDSQGDPVIVDGAVVSVDHAHSGAADTAFYVEPTGGRINFTSTNVVSGSSAFRVSVIPTQSQ